MLFFNGPVTFDYGADSDNLKRGYDGKHEKGSSKSLQTRSPLGAFCFGIDSASYGQPLRCEPQDSGLSFPPAARNYRL